MAHTLGVFPGTQDTPTTDVSCSVCCPVLENYPLANLEAFLLFAGRGGLALRRNDGPFRG